MSLARSVVKINKYSILLIAFFIPLHIRFTGFLIAVAALTWLINNRFRISIPKHDVPLFLCFIALYACYAAGMIYTDLSEIGWQKMQLRLSMVLFPLIFFSDPLQKLIDIRTFMKWFTAGGIAVSIYLLDHAAYLYLTKHWVIFWDQHITFGTGLSVTYLSIYFVVMIVFLIIDLQELELSFFNKLIHYSILLLLIFMLLSFSSRTEIISLVIVFAGLVFIHPAKAKEKRSRRIGFGIALVVIFVLIILAYPSSGQRLFNMVKQWNEPYTDQHPTSENMRRVTWKISFDQILQKPLEGVGTGDVDTTLFKIYSDQKLTWPLNDRLNSHNQYLQTSMAIGIIGLSALLLCFSAALIKAIKNRDRLYIAFLIVVIIACCAESVLETEAGVVFFAYFNSLFASRETKEYLRE